MLLQFKYLWSYDAQSGVPGIPGVSKPNAVESSGVRRFVTGAWKAIPPFLCVLSVFSVLSVVFPVFDRAHLPLAGTRPS